MMPIYVGFAVIIVLILAGFGISNWFANHAKQQAIAFDMSTPSPWPSPTSKPLQVVDLKPIGQPTGFPVPDLRKGIVSDTSAGGHGQDVDGIPCQTMEVGVMHVHSHLSIFANGKQVQVPAFIGITPTPTGGCLYWLHTHGPDGIIHVEAGDVSAPGGGPFTLGNFFDIWGQPLTRTQVGPFKGPVVAYVNGWAYDGDLKSIPLRAHQVITLEVGTPVVPPPNYKLPPND
jgi:hypothetical protein